MADVVVLGAGLGGTLMAYELAPQLRDGDTLTLIGQGSRYHFVPSNPWVAVGWRNRADIEIDLEQVMRRKQIRLLSQGAQHVRPAENRIEMTDGTSVSYDYLVIATGPDLAFDEIAGLGPGANTQSICHVDHAEQAWRAFEAFCKNPGPIVVGAVQGASCFGPAYEFAFILDTELRKRRHPRSGADDFRHRRTLYRPSRSGWRGRHQGTDGERVPQPSHQVDHQRSGQGRGGECDAGRRTRRIRGAAKDA